MNFLKRALGMDKKKPLTKKQIENTRVSENNRFWGIYLRDHYNIINTIIKENSNLDDIVTAKKNIKRLIKFQDLIDNPILMLNIDNIGLSALEEDKKAATKYIKKFLNEKKFTSKDITKALEEKWLLPVLKKLKQCFAS